MHLNHVHRRSSSTGRCISHLHFQQPLSITSTLSNSASSQYIAYPSTPLHSLHPPSPCSSRLPLSFPPLSGGVAASPLPLSFAMAYNIKAAIRAAKNMQYEPIEVKVREATNNDPWGQSTSVMSDIARATHHHDEYSLLFKMVWKRLNDVEHVMHVQKALILTDYLLRNGAERFINDAKRRSRDISALQKYKQYDANNRDVGGEVRAKAKSVYELLTNDAKLAEERAKAQAIRDVKLSGMGSDGYGPGEAGGEGGGRGGEERDQHRDRFTEGEEGGDSPRGEREHDWEKEQQPEYTTHPTHSNTAALPHCLTASLSAVSSPALCGVSATTLRLPKAAMRTRRRGRRRRRPRQRLPRRRKKRQMRERSRSPAALHCPTPLLDLSADRAGLCCVRV